MTSPDETLVVCVGEHDDHIEASILTHCCKCGCRVWCSITNSDRKPVCMPCVVKMNDTPGHEISIFTTPETMAEALREVAKREKKSKE